VGTPEFARRVAHAAVDKSLNLINEILQLQDNHRQFILLKWRMSGYKIQHLLKVLPSTLYAEEVETFDDALNHALVVTLGFPLTPADRRLIDLPPSLGGLGLPSAKSLAGATYLASCASSSSLQAESLNLDPQFNREKVVVLLRDFCKDSRIREDEFDVDELLGGRKVQMNILRVANRAKANYLLLSLGAHQKALFESARTKEYVPWINVLPSAPLNQHLHNAVFKTAVGYQLGKKFLKDSRAKCEKCTSMMDPYGDHATVCRKAEAQLCDTTWNEMRSILFFAILI